MKNTTKRIWSLILAGMMMTAFLAGCNSRGGDGDTSGSSSSEVDSAWENPIGNPRGDSDYVPEIPDVMEQFKQADAQNSDTVGWLQIPDTEINEAVVQTTDNEYYYRRDALKQDSFAGSLWMDYESTIGDGAAEDFSQNVIIYGHNLGNPQGVKDDPNGVKFAQLFKFDDIDFAKEHPYFYFTSPSGEHVYEIFAVFYSEDVTSPVPYHFAEYEPERFQKLITDVRDRSQFDYNVTVGLDDKIMTLSTCTYKYGTYSQNPHQRFVIMGRLVGEGEPFYETADVQVNPDPKEPDFSKV